MNPRASVLINNLDLMPYKEGGYFCEVFKSSIPVHLPNAQEERMALTTIYYMLVAGEHDSWHQLSGDEVWHYHEGDPLELFWIEQGAETYTRCLIGPVGNMSWPIAVVPGGCWQMARTTGDYTLVGCTVGPGFVIEDYKLLRDISKEASEIQRRFPELAEYLYASKTNTAHRTHRFR